MPDLSKNSIIYMPENSNEINGVLQIIHGFGEHQGRYRNFAQDLAAEGYVVLTSDLKGCGNHISREGELGFFGDNAVSRLVGDIHENTKYLKKQFPEIPHFLMGFGEGALIAAVYFKKYDNFVDGLILSGMPSDPALRLLYTAIVKLAILLKGEYHRSKLLDRLINSKLYHAFSRDASRYSYLSAEQANVQKYEEDTKCGYILTLNGFDTYFDLMNKVYSSGSWIKKNTECPVRFFCGEEDPCLINQKHFSKTVHLFTENGYKNTAYVISPGMRHEVFFDLKKDSVFQKLLEELEEIHDSIIPKAVVVSKNKHIVLEDFIDPEVDKPFIKDEKLNLEDFINVQKEKKNLETKVEVIDFNDIKGSENISSEEMAQALNDLINDAIGSSAAEVLPKEEEKGTSTPLDKFTGFKIDPDNIEGMEDSED